MNRMLLGAVATLLLMGVGLFWLQGRAETERGAPPPEAAAGVPADDADADPDALPSADLADMEGPAPPEVPDLSREQRRFARYDHNHDGRITRNEMLAPRVAAFRKLDKDGNNLLTFEEWAVATSDRFKAADANGDLALSPQEFASTRPKRNPKPKCGC